MHIVPNDLRSKERSAFLRFTRETWQSNRHLLPSWKAHFAEHELPKTPEEKYLIDLANTITNDFSQKYGGDAIEIIPEKVHLLPKAPLGTVPELMIDGGGIVFPFSGQIILKAPAVRKHPIAFLKVLTHEMLHAKSFLSATIRDERSRKRRGGLTFFGDGHRNSLRMVGLDEALNEEATFRCIIKARTDPGFIAIAADAFDEEAKQARHAYAQRHGARSAKFFGRQKMAMMRNS